MNWGLIGFGEITPAFIEGLRTTNKFNLVGIASVSSYEYLKKKNLYNNVQIFKSYKELAESPEVNIIYISTTNNLHFDNAITVLKNGKHLLCEKPLTPNAKQTEELIKTAKRNNLFLMEGMWTRFLPVYRKFIQLINDGVIGNPKLLKADFGFLNNWPDNRRLLNPNLYGGTLLDNADYNIFLSQDIFKEFPIDIASQATFSHTGVEDACSIILKYPSGGMAQLYSSFRCNTKQEAIIYGEKGYIELNEYWHGTQIVINTGNKTKSLEFPLRANGFEYQIEAVQDTIRQGKLENDVVTHIDSINVAKIIDKVKCLIEEKK